MLHAAHASEDRAERERSCPECLTAFLPAKEQQLFCSTEHRVAWTNRWTVRGRRGMILAATARATRNGTRANAPSFAAQASADADYLIRLWRREDKAAGRMSCEEFVAQRYRTGFDPL